MHPTTEEHLAAVRRLLDVIDADAGLSESSRLALGDAARLLRRIERSSAARLPFLVWDNRVSVELLARLADMAPDIVDAVPEIADAAHHHEPDAHEVNKQLRGLLSRGVRELPDDDAADAWRTRLARHLRERITTDPAINRPKGLTR